MKVIGNQPRVHKTHLAFNDNRNMTVTMKRGRRKKDTGVDQRLIKDMELLQTRIDRSARLLHDELWKIYSKSPSETAETPPSSTRSEPVVEGRQKEDRPRRASSLFPLLKPPIIPSFSSSSDATSPDSSSGVSNIAFEEEPIPPDDNDEIVFPEGVIDRRPYMTIAQYRRMVGKSTNFVHDPIHIGENETETVVLGLERFAREHHCQLIFSDQDHGFSGSIESAAHGTVDLGSIHLLATDSLQTANFKLEMNLDLFDEFRQSQGNFGTFVTDFSQAVASILSCDPTCVSVSSIYHCMEKEKKKYEVKLGLTAIDVDTTDRLAQDFQNRIRTGFDSEESILRHVKSGVYDYKWEPVLKYLKIQPSDLEPMFNFDYPRSGPTKKEKRGGYPYHLPLGWYRHSLKVADKYEVDAKWLGSDHAGKEWAVAYYGTKVGAVAKIVQQGLRMDQKKTDVFSKSDKRRGIVVTTHCDGGAYPTYSEPFSVLLPSGKIQRFSLMFQCRVKPGKFSTHRKLVEKGKAWRFLDPHHIRPYGLLLKEEKELEMR